MNANESFAERSLRVVLGTLLGMTIILKLATGAIAIVAGISAGVALITGVAGACAIYSFFGYASCKAVERN